MRARLAVSRQSRGFEPAPEPAACYRAAPGGGVSSGGSNRASLRSRRVAADVQAVPIRLVQTPTPHGERAADSMHWRRW